MDRRAFIESLSLGSMVVLAPAGLAGCSAGDAAAFEAWNGPPPGETDIRRMVLCYGLLAPNPHNTQAWIIALTGPDSFDLYVDQSRLLAATDPPFRQIHIGQGTFLENVAIGARQHGRRADISYFPQGEYGPTEIARAPVASVRLVEDKAAAADPLFAQILVRVSNKRAYDNKSIAQDMLDAVSAAAAVKDGQTLQFLHKPPPRLPDMLEEAMRIEVADATRANETINYFRFNDQERLQLRDGFGVAQAGQGKLGAWIAESFVLSREKVRADPSAFNAQAVEITGKQARTASAFGWLASANNTRSDQLEAGRTYQRIALGAAAQGLAMHPMSQVLQEYADMAALQREFLTLIGAPADATVQMLFRLGHAAPTAHTPRRRLDDLIET
jgi:type IV secretory pathway TrbD component